MGIAQMKKHTLQGLEFECSAHAAQISIYKSRIKELEDALRGLIEYGHPRDIEMAKKVLEKCSGV